LLKPLKEVSYSRRLSGRALVKVLRVGGGYLERSERLDFRFRDAVIWRLNELKSLSYGAVNRITNRSIR
jgi:hypothetical protein